jgi:hypothetical protein
MTPCTSMPYVVIANVACVALGPMNVAPII